MKKFAIILSGCGVYDGTEIHEAVMAMLAVKRNAAEYSIFAPDKEQMHVVNHLNGEVMNETRNVLTESARIARGSITPLGQLKSGAYDGLILPGGYGAAKNLSSYAVAGSAMMADPEIEVVLRDFHAAARPIGAMCISPVILAKIFVDADLTIGKDPGTASHIEAMGARHHISGHGTVIIDHKNRFVTTPCYMIDASIADIAEDADQMVKAMLKLMV